MRLYTPSLRVRQIPKNFRYEEFHEVTDRELRATGKSYEGGFGPRLAQ